MVKYKLLFLLSCISTLATAQNIDELIQKHLQAIGGERKWNAVTNYVMEGVRLAEGLEVQEKKQVILNKSLRIDYKFKSRNTEIAAKDYFLIVNGNQGWRYLPDNLRDSTEKLTINDIEVYREQMSFDDPFINFNSRNIKLAFLNIEPILDKRYFKVSASYADGSSEYIYLDMKTYLIYKRVSLNPNSEREFTYESYLTTETGLMVPNLIVSLTDEFQVSRFKTNVAIVEGTFKPNIKSMPTQK